MRFGGVHAVRDVNFTLGEGELRCLIGPNGAGKSTFFKMLTGQLKPTSGTVLLRGEDVTGAEPHDIARRGVGIKTQVPSVFDGLTVRENLWLAASRMHRGAGFARRSTPCSSALASPPSLHGSSGNWLTDSANGSNLAWCSRRIPILCCSTSPRPE